MVSIYLQMVITTSCLIKTMDVLFHLYLIYIICASFFCTNPLIYIHSSNYQTQKILFDMTKDPIFSIPTILIPHIYIDSNNSFQNVLYDCQIFINLNLFLVLIDLSSVQVMTIFYNIQKHSSFLPSFLIIYFY